MPIRNAAKALLYENGKVLLNSHLTEEGKVYYDLPGGGQHTYETMEEAVIREVLEETGIPVESVQFQAIAEEIWDDPAMRKTAPEYCHRMMHIFLVRPLPGQRQQRAEMDLHQTGSVWVTPEEADQLPLVPVQLQGRMRQVLESPVPVYLGSVHNEGFHKI